MNNDDLSILNTNSTIISVSLPSNKILRKLKKKREILDYDLTNEPITSKFRFDSLNKRVKARFFNMVHKTISSFVNIKLMKLPQKVVTNVNIKYNKLLLKKSIMTIYRENVESFPSNEEFIKILPLNRQSEFFDILNSTFIDSFNNFISCPIFQNNLKDIQRKKWKFV